MIVRYLTHPQVEIDPAVPVERWGLNEIGRRRVTELAGCAALSATRTVVSSAETKAIETAQPIAEALGQPLVVRQAMHENDRSATGFLQPEEFERTADAFFAAPETSVRGWELAVDAQYRIVREAEAALGEAEAGDVLFVGHGAVGTLLMCHLGGWPIDRERDQPAGGGNFFAFDRDTGRLNHGWLPLEKMADVSRGSAA